VTEGVVGVGDDALHAVGAAASSCHSARSAHPWLKPNHQPPGPWNYPSGAAGSEQRLGSGVAILGCRLLDACLYQVFLAEGRPPRRQTGPCGPSVADAQAGIGEGLAGLRDEAPAVAGRVQGQLQHAEGVAVADFAVG